MTQPPQSRTRLEPWAFGLTIPLVGLSLFALGLMARAWLSDGGMQSLMLGSFSLAAVVTIGLALMLRRRWWPWLESILERHAAHLDGLPIDHLGKWIALAAGAGIFAELTLIRVHASFFQFFAYFKNITLLACFLGLGLGYALGTRRGVGTPLFLPLLAIQVAFLYLLRSFTLAPILQNPVMEQLTMGYAQIGEWVDVVVVYGFLVFIFPATALTFVPLGQLVSRLMARKEKLHAYGANLLGSLAAILVFHTLAALWTPPAVWLAVSAAGILPFLRQRRALLANLVMSVGLVAVLSWTPDPQRADVYSPYQILTLSGGSEEPPVVQVNNVFFQSMLDLREDDGAGRGLHYGLPYRFKPTPGRVLVVGAGTGNDVAAALRHGAARVDAVEIDPVILDFGRALHPEAPYSDPRVRAIVDDARSYIRNTRDQYDLIVYGLLDSHTLLAGLSGIRLDSYVYTVEAFQEARHRLAPNGVLSVSFLVLRPELALKIYLMMEEAFGGEPILILAGRDTQMTFLSGEGVDWDNTEVPSSFRRLVIDDWRDLEADPSTDDWPFLYMPVRRYPQTYLAMVLLLLTISLLLVRSLAGTETIDLADGRGFSLPCFFLGAGFMLVETKAITELALAFGSTWQVVGFTIGAILILAFLANLFVMRLGTPPTALTYTALAGAVVLGLVLSPRVMGAVSPQIDGYLMTGLLTFPLFFSGLAFSSELAKARSVGVAMASNLLGAMLGGFLEYNSMYFGFRSLYVLALALYGLAFLTTQRDYARSPGA
jgi:SAM-dependent methyltransferase